MFKPSKQKRRQCGAGRHTVRHLPSQDRYSRHLRVEPLEDRRLLSITVNTLLDEADGSITDGDISLRDAIAAATPGETIDFSVTGAIALTLGELGLTDSLTIQGPGADLLTIDAHQNSRIFSITSTRGDFTIAGLTLTGGRTTGDNVDLEDNTYSGGSIRSLTTGSLTIHDSEISGNVVTGGLTAGGGIFALGPTVINNSTVSNNEALLFGGGISAHGPLSLSESSVAENTAGIGGGILTLNVTTISDSSIEGNSGGGEGGGLYAGGPLSITGTTISNNSTTANQSGGGGIRFAPGGREIDRPEFRGAQAVIIGSTISDNSTGGGGGGGVLAFGTLTIINSKISGNSAYLITPRGPDGKGGGISHNGGSLTIIDATIANNDAAFDGGGIKARTNVIVKNSIIANNTAGTNGGGMSANGAEILNSTISGNAAVGSGGGIHASVLGETHVHIAGSTVANNVAHGAGGGVWVYDWRGNGSVAIDNSIVAGNLDNGSGHDITVDSGTLSANYSLIGDNSGTDLPATGLTPDPLTGNLVGSTFNPINPLLSPLADNGGPTETHLPMSGSPVIDAADPLAVATWSEIPLYDQRGLAFDRVIGDRLDMGAVEYAAVSANFNEDLRVDGRDFLAWQRGYGISSGANQEDGDANSDGAVNALDRTIWEKQYGANAVYSDPIVVDTLSDNVDGNITSGNFSLREAIEVANWLPGEQTITFDAGMFATPQTLLLTDGDLQVLDSLSVNGPGANLLTIDAQQNSRIFTSIAPELTIHGLTLTGGRPAADQNGGAIHSINVRLTQSTISGNSVSGEGAGGGIYAINSVTLTQSTVSRNHTNYLGNFGGGHGGGVFGWDSVTLSQSTVSGNTTRTGKGAGVFAVGLITLTQSTITGNKTQSGNYSYGGGIYARYATIHGSIIAGNTAVSGNHDLRIKNNLLAVEYSLIGNTGGLSITGPGNILNQNPLLAPLANNGGPTQTHALLPSSPAIDAGNPSAVAGVGGVPLFDQRGNSFGRVQNGRIDIGAYEVQPATLASTDFDDVVLWQEPYGQTPLVDIATSISAGASSNKAELIARAGLIDAALALEWMSAAEPEALTDVVAETYSESVSISQENSQQLLTTVASGSALGLQTVNEEPSEPTIRVLLSDKVLEKVFG